MLSSDPFPESATIGTIIDIAHEAGQLAMSHFGRLSESNVASKGHLDLVTIADREVEERVGQLLSEAFPEDGIFGEEGSAVKGSSGRIWVVDPIDGTFNFVRGGDQWAVSIGLYAEGRPQLGVIHVPVRQVTVAGGAAHPPTLNGDPLSPLGAYAPDRASVGVGLGRDVPAERRLELLQYLMCEAGISFRCCNSATLSLLEVMTGEVDGYIGFGDASWDVMAAWPILNSLGAASTLNWPTVDLASKLQYGIGKRDLVKQLSPLGLERVDPKVN